MFIFNAFIHRHFAELSWAGIKPYTSFLILQSFVFLLNSRCHRFVPILKFKITPYPKVTESFCRVP